MPLRELRIKGSFLNLIKILFPNPKANIKLNGESQDYIPFRIRKHRTTNEKEKDGKTNKQIFVGDTLKSAREVSSLGLIGEFTKLASCKINIQCQQYSVRNYNEDSIHDNNSNKMRFLDINALRKLHNA